MMKPCFILQLKDLCHPENWQISIPGESLISQCSKLIHAEVSINRIEADSRVEWSGISLHEVTNIHPLPADAPIDRRCNVRKFKIQVEPDRVPGSTSSRYGRTLSFRSVLRGANLNRRSSLWQWGGTCAFGEIKPSSRGSGRACS
jgi:hypothetical protein